MGLQLQLRAREAYEGLFGEADSDPGRTNGTMIFDPDEVEPDLVVGSWKLWVDGRLHPDLQDYWDGNWLVVRTRCEEQGATVDVSRPLLRNADLARFGVQCRSMCETMRGEAVLEPLEPNLYVRLRIDELGHVATEVRITPDHLTQRHVFHTELDQSYVPAIVASIERIVQRYPIRGDPTREA